MNEDPEAPLAMTTLCTVTRAEHGHVEVRLGNVTVHMNERDLASLSGTLQKVTRKLFPRRPVAAPFRVIQGGLS